MKEYYIAQDNKHWFIHDESRNIKIYSTNKDDLIGYYQWIRSVM